MCRQTPGLATLAFVTKWLAEHISSPPVLVTTIRLWKVALALPLRKCSGPASSSPSWTVQRGQEGRGPTLGGHIVGGKGLGWGTQKFIKTTQQKHYKTQSTTIQGWPKVSIPVDLQDKWPALCLEDGAGVQAFAQ